MTVIRIVSKDNSFDAFVDGNNNSAIPDDINDGANQREEDADAIQRSRVVENEPALSVDNGVSTFQDSAPPKRKKRNVSFGAVVDELEERQKTDKERDLIKQVTR